MAKPARKLSAPPPEEVPRVVGEVKMVAIDKVAPNSWNPNEFTPHLMASLKHGLKEDGWLISQSMLVWGKDNKGKPQNLIIDGEHRWLAAKELGFTSAPMVFLDGLTEAKAKALTIKLDAKRGKFGQWKLSELVQELQNDLDVPDLGMELGFEDDVLMAILAADTEEVTTGVPVPERKSTGLEDGAVRSAGSHVKLVQLYFSADQYVEWNRAIRVLAKRLSKENVTDAALAAVLLLEADK